MARAYLRYSTITASDHILMAMIKDTLHSPPRGQTLPQALSPDHPHYETILSRAHQIQRQKDTEQQILRATEALLDVDFPSLDLTQHHSIIADVKRHLNLFQPSDYDSLIEERNIAGKCGYVFCAHPHRSEGTDAPFRILTAAGKSEGAFKVVPRRTLEQWCSERCARKALYVRVQLGEEPAWMRGDGADGEITLLEEVEARRKDEADVGVLADAIRGLDVRVASDGMAKALAALAVERGSSARSGTAPGVDEVVVRENVVGGVVRPPDIRLEDYSSIEGYKPRGSERASESSARST